VKLQGPYGSGGEEIPERLPLVELEVKKISEGYQYIMRINSILHFYDV
jgi:hypothetical protein